MAIETPIEDVKGTELADRLAPIARAWARLPLIHLTLSTGHGEKMRQAVADEGIDYLYLADKGGENAILCTAVPFPWHRISRFVRLAAWARGPRAGVELSGRDAAEWLTGLFSDSPPAIIQAGERWASLIKE